MGNKQQWIIMHIPNRKVRSRHLFIFSSKMVQWGIEWWHNSGDFSWWFQTYHTKKYINQRTKKCMRPLHKYITGSSQYRSTLNIVFTTATQIQIQSSNKLWSHHGTHFAYTSRHLFSICHFWPTPSPCIENACLGEGEGPQLPRPPTGPPRTAACQWAVSSHPIIGLPVPRHPSSTFPTFCGLWSSYKTLSGSLHSWPLDGWVRRRPGDLGQGEGVGK